MKLTLLGLFAVLALGACAHKHDHRGPASLRMPASGPRDYRIYETAGEFALAWGCKDMKVDFERLDYDEAYERSLILDQNAPCKIQNVLLNTYEDRVIKDLGDNEFWRVRSHGMNHQKKSIKALGEVATVNQDFTSNGMLYALEDGMKWTSTEQLFAAITPYADGKPIETRVVWCGDCDAAAERAIVDKLKLSKKLQNYATSMSFFRPQDGNNFDIVANLTGEVPKNDAKPSLDVKALFKIKLDTKANTMSLEFVKILKASKI